MTRPIAVVQADVFTTRPFGGNPALAVLDADGLDEAAMQRIAGELRAPGTAFVSAPTRPGADWRLRMFTPRREVGYSGHTALGGTHALIEAGRVPGGRRSDRARVDLYDLSDPARLGAVTAEAFPMPAPAGGGLGAAWSCHPGA